jgi:uncharacterized coiled-coil protein SlyX
MSYTNTTTHYQWPLPEETDLFNGLDDNQMKEDLDEKIYNLDQRSTGDHEAVTQLNTRVTEVEETVGGYDEQIEQLEGTVAEHAERLVNLTNRQTELSRRLNGKAGESTIAPEYNEEESYSVGDFVYHNNILYKAVAASATPAGEFDADDWDIAILTDELSGSTPGTIAAANVSFDDTVAQIGASNVQAAIVALNNDLTSKITFRDILLTPDNAGTGVIPNISANEQVIGFIGSGGVYAWVRNAFNTDNGFQLVEYAPSSGTFQTRTEPFTLKAIILKIGI